MSASRTPLWDSKSQARYFANHDQSVREAADRHHGEHTAAVLDDIWQSLSEDERAFMELLVLSQCRTIIARYQDALFTSLLDKELLQIPPGVGTLLMQKMETSYSVPAAVWRRLVADPRVFCRPYTGTTEQRMAELHECVGDRIQAMVGRPAAAADPA